MQKSVEIQVNEKTFKLGFGLEVFMNLGEIWGFDTLEEVNERFQVLTQFVPGKTSLSNMKVMSEIVEAMVSGNSDNVEFVSAREIRCLDIQQFQNVIINLVNGFSQNMPQNTVGDDYESEKKLKAQGKNKSRPLGTK
jgi:hypothetical protein